MRRTIRLLSILALCLAGLPAALLAQPLPADGDGTFGRFVDHPRAANRSYSFQQVGGPAELIREGRRSHRVEVRPGDCGGEDCRADRERVERWHRAGTRPGQPTWYSWSIRLARDFPYIRPTNTTLGQFKQEPQGCEVAGVGIENQRLFFYNKLCDSNGGATYMIDQPFMRLDRARGRWIDLMVHTNWSPGPDGFMDVYVDGERIASHRGRVTYNARDRVDFRYGIYRSFVSRHAAQTGRAVPAQVAYFDNIRRGPTRASVDIRQ